MDSKKLKDHKNQGNFNEVLQGNLVLMQNFAERIKQIVKKQQTIDEDQTAIMSKQIDLERRVEKIEAAAGFRSSFVTRLFNKKNHLSHLDSKKYWKRVLGLDDKRSAADDSDQGMGI